MGIYLEGRYDRLMPEDALSRLRWDVSLKQQRGDGMPYLMQGNPWQFKEICYLIEKLDKGAPVHWVTPRGKVEEFIFIGIASSGVFIQ